MRRFYFDHNATTPVSPEVLEVFTRCLGQEYGNASSIHYFGQSAKRELEAARRQVAQLLHCHPTEVVFLSGGTEGDNLAVLGAVRAFERAGRHVVTTAIEHPAVLNACAQLEREGVKVTYLLPDGNGIVRAEDVKRVLRPDTVLVSVMHANNEVGTLQRLGEIAQVTRAAGVCFHSDGVQAVGKVPVDVDTLGVDLYTLTAHKFYGPKGVGALYVRKGTNLAPTSFGGHHERDRRAGTENVPAAVALGRAAQWVTENLAEEAARLGVLRDRLEADILARVAECGVNAAGAPRTPNTSSIWFDHIEGEALLIALDLSGFAVSSGAACSSGAVTPSHVLTAIGLPAQRARATIRFSLGRANTAADVDALVEAVAGEVARLRKLSPVAQAR